MYSKNIIEEFYNPFNFGVIRGANGVGKVVCQNGDEIIKFFLSVENNKIVDSQFQTFGGVVAIALSSFANRFLINKTLKDASKIEVKDIVAMAENVPENRMYLVHAVVSCARAAVESVGKKNANIDD